MKETSDVILEQRKEGHVDALLPQASNAVQPEELSDFSLLPRPKSCRVVVRTMLKQRRVLDRDNQALRA